MKKHIAPAELVEKKLLCPDHYFMRFHSPGIVRDALPGQFVNLLTGVDGVILRRPFSFTRADAKEGTFDIIYRVVGPGTAWLAELEEGEAVDTLGPLGRGFELDNAGVSPCVVGGGVGIPPLIWVVEELHRDGKRPHIYLGARVEDHLFGLDGFREMGYEPVLATEDGSVGTEGFITLALKKNLDPKKITQVYSCGRIEMLRSLTGWGTPIVEKVQVSLECKMACGFGPCLGCAVPARRGGYFHACRDGPVFTLSDVDLSRMK